MKIIEEYPLNILVAEDNAINQKLIMRIFQMLGYTIQIASNGYKVIEILDQMKIDIIFMDIQMPEMDGIEATSKIIAQWGDQRPMIIAMTANALQSDKETYRAAGMDDYISKPLTVDQIRIGIEKWAPVLNKGKK
ncbi:MAG: response regulator [Mariniphaga sp.]